MCSRNAYFIKIHPEAIIPAWGTKESSACDLTTIVDAIIEPKKVVKIRTGLVAKPPLGYHWELSLRSSTPTKHYVGLILANSIGIIDSDYCGITRNSDNSINEADEILIPVLNILDDKTIYIPKGKRIAQLILRETLNKIFIKEVSVSDYISMCNKNDKKKRGGFGSTGD
jgi:dUTP pyrophosphatase